MGATFPYAIALRLDRGDQRGFLRSASAGAKLFSKLGTYLIVPKYLPPSTKDHLRVRRVLTNPLIESQRLMYSSRSLRT